jgi:hypothetical protein
MYGPHKNHRPDSVRYSNVTGWVLNRHWLGIGAPPIAVAGGVYFAVDTADNGCAASSQEGFPLVGEGVTGIGVADGVTDAGTTV